MVSCETCLGLTACLFLCSPRTLRLGLLSYLTHVSAESRVLPYAAYVQNTFAVSRHTWVLAAQEAFGAFLARLVWEEPAGAHGPLAREKSQRRTWRSA